MARYTLARVIRPTEGYAIANADTKCLTSNKIYKTREEAEAALIRISFGPYAEEIIARMECGESFDSAVQTVFSEVYE